MEKFKVGDVVRVVSDNIDDTIGHRGTIEDIDDYFYNVKFFKLRKRQCEEDDNWISTATRVMREDELEIDTIHMFCEVLDKYYKT